MGQTLQPVFQSPFVILPLAGLLMIFALHLGDIIELRFPASSYFSRYVAKRPSTSLVSAASMGAISTLALSPCVTPPLIGALTYIAETGHLAMGISALFVLGLGFGAPLLLSARLQNTIFPKQVSG